MYLEKVLIVKIDNGKMSSVGASKRKEIYKYNAPWIVYGMNWSVRPDKRFRLALGSFIEEYSNKVYTVNKFYSWLITCFCIRLAGWHSVGRIFSVFAKSAVSILMVLITLATQ